ncbi:MAG: DUF3592 domain-containing protein [Cellulomonas sp.]|uniref:DUF3592 domain-containing protein n=1 Tax=Cellulomonas sp. TaxID=40001 RepID=UPI0019ECB82E|nr:DUF3592 domain-containing protein [Cellulomonas sp.]MBF0689497.1 DUF3592 domain-containing protein [Cellulomonas sp.]
MSMGLLLAAIPVLLFLGIGVALLLGGLAMSRRASDRGERVAVEAVVVERSSFTDPARITFDYPLPGGGWARATRVEGAPSPGVHGAARHPGERITVWVDPRRPDDVRLPGARSASGLGGGLLTVLGGLLCAFALGIGAVAVAFAR